jgi:hypothetical protein
VAVRSPKPAKDYRLGQLLPNQQPKPPAAYPKAINLFLPFILKPLFRFSEISSNLSGI